MELEASPEKSTRGILSNGSRFATCSGGGHNTFDGHLKGMEPIVSTLRIPEGNFHVVLGSDGFGDVFHPEDEVLRCGNFDAEELVIAAYRRWRDPCGIRGVPGMVEHTMANSGGR